MSLAIPEVDTTVYRQGPADWMTITAKLVPTTTDQTKIEDDPLPVTRPVVDIDTSVTPEHLAGVTLPISDFYKVLKSNPDNAIQMTDVFGKEFFLTAIGKTRDQPILYPTMERSITSPFAISCAAPVAIVTAAADEEFTLEQAIEEDKIRNREFWYMTVGQPMLTVGDKGVISTNRMMGRQNVSQDRPIILLTYVPYLILVGDVLMYTWRKPVQTYTPELITLAEDL